MKGIGFLLLGAVFCLTLGCAEQSADSYVAAASEALAEKDLNVATIELKNALQLDPEHREARMLLGSAHLQMGDIDSAIKELKRAQDLGVSNDRVLPELYVALSDPIGPARPFEPETPPSTAGDSSASWILLSQVVRYPRNRVNSTRSNRWGNRRSRESW